MKLYKIIGLLISVFLLNLLYFNSVSAQILTKQITGYMPTSSVRAVNGDNVLGSKEIWTYTGNLNDQQSRKTDDRTGGWVVAPKGWVYYGGTTTKTTLPESVAYKDADGYTGTLYLDKDTYPYYGWDRYLIMGYNGLYPDGSTRAYTFTKNYLVPGKTNEYYNGSTLEDIGVYSGVVSKSISKPIAVIDAPTSTHTGNTVLVKGSGSDPNGLAITEYSWTSSNGQTLTGTGGNIKVDAPVTLTLKVKNSAEAWSETTTHIINIDKETPAGVLNVNVHYQNDGVDIAPMEIYTPDPGLYTATAKAITNYTIIAPSSQTITVVAGQTYNIYFNYNFVGPTSIQAGLLQYFVDQDGKELHEHYDNTDNAGEYDIPALKFPGYELRGKDPRHVTLISGKTTTIYFIYDKIVPLPPYVSLNIRPSTIHQGETALATTYAGDPKNLPITYTWTTSDGQVITGSQGTLIAGAKPTIVSVYVTNSIGLKSPVSTAVLTPTNNPPQILLYASKTANIGEDVHINSTIFDPDGDTWTTVWTTPPIMVGKILDNGESTVCFKNATDVNKTYKFDVTATDQFGLSATSSISTTILPIVPNATINLSGTQKENRLQKLTTTDTGGSSTATIVARKFEFVDNSNNVLRVDSNPTSSNILKSLEPLTNASINFLIKKAGTYTAKYTVTNNYGLSTTIEKAITVFQDVIPTAPYPTITDGDENTKGTPKAPYANPKNTDAKGHALYTRTLTDNAVSNDGDIVAHRYWIRAWDSNNNGNLHDDNNAEIFDNGAWKSLGRFTTDGNSYLDEIPNLDLTKINDGNLRTVKSESPWVGNYYYYLISKEDFGQPTIPQLIIPLDYRISDRADVLK